jgi:hypothetical protein
VGLRATVRSNELFVSVETYRPLSWDSLQHRSRVAGVNRPPARARQESEIHRWWPSLVENGRRLGRQIESLVRRKSGLERGGDSSSVSGPRKRDTRQKCSFFDPTQRDTRQRGSLLSQIRALSSRVLLSVQPDEGRVADVDATSPAPRPSFDGLGPWFFWNASRLAANAALPGAEEGKAEEGEQTDCPSGAARFAHRAS